MVKSNNEIGKVNDKKKSNLKTLIMKQENSEIGKKVLTDGLDQSQVQNRQKNMLVKKEISKFKYRSIGGE